MKDFIRMKESQLGKKLIYDETLFLTKTTLKPVEAVKIQANTKYINCTIQTLKKPAQKQWLQ